MNDDIEAIINITHNCVEIVLLPSCMVEVFNCLLAFLNEKIEVKNDLIHSLMHKISVK